MNSAQRKHGVNFDSISQEPQELYRELHRQNVDIVEIDTGAHGLMEVKLQRAEIQQMLDAGRGAMDLFIAEGALGGSAISNTLVSQILSRHQSRQQSMQVVDDNEDEVQKALRVLRQALRLRGESSSNLDDVERALCSAEALNSTESLRPARST